MYWGGTGTPLPNYPATHPVRL